MFALGQNYVFGPSVRVNDDSPCVTWHQTYSQGQHLIACRGDTVYLVWRGDQTGTTHVYFSRSNDGGSSFLPSVQVDSTSGVFPSLAVDDSGRIHVAWLNGNSAGGSFTYYSKSTDGGQSFLSPIRACDSVSHQQYALPSIAVSRDGCRIYVVRSEAGWIMLSRSIDGGTTFLTPDTRVNADTSRNQYDPTIAAFQDSIAFVAWDDGGRRACLLRQEHRLWSVLPTTFSAVRLSCGRYCS